MKLFALVKAAGTVARRRPRLVLLALLCLPVLGLTVREGQTRWLARRHARAAEEALGRFDFDRAYQHLDAAAHARPSDPTFPFQAARAARRAGQYDEAERLLRDAQRLGTRPAMVALEQALLLAQAGHLDSTRGPLEKQLGQRHPDSPLILEALALGSVHVYNLQGAYDYWNDLLTLQPDQPYALVWRGRVQEGMMRFDGALDDYRRAVELAPDYPDARRLLGRCLLQHHQRAAEAALQLEAVLPLAAGDEAARIELARCYQKLGRLEEAAALLDDVLTRRPTDANALAERGRVALAEAPTEAEGWLRRSLQADPHAREHLYLMYQCLERLGRSEEAAATLARFRATEADLKQLEELVRQIGKAPGDPALRWQAGDLCMRNGQTSEAVRWFLGALAIDPDHAATHAALAAHYERLGDVERAASHRRRGE